MEGQITERRGEEVRPGPPIEISGYATAIDLGMYGIAYDLQDAVIYVHKCKKANFGALTNQNSEAIVKMLNTLLLKLRTYSN